MYVLLSLCPSAHCYRCPCSYDVRDVLGMRLHMLLETMEGSPGDGQADSLLRLQRDASGNFGRSKILRKESSMRSGAISMHIGARGASARHGGDAHATGSEEMVQR